jgi:hypothetical protein
LGKATLTIFDSMSSSAPPGTESGTVRPSDFAVFMFDDKFELRDLLHRQVEVIGAGMDRSREPHD